MTAQGARRHRQSGSDEHETTTNLNALEKAMLETMSRDRKEVAEYSSSDENDPSIEELNKLNEVKVIRKPLDPQEQPARFELVR